jgi:hypothetical protein
VSHPESVSREQECPKYQKACDTAAFITRSVHERTPFLDEDSYREYYRECREDIYMDEWTHDYF